MNKKLKVALAAYGMSGRLFHAPFLLHHSGFELVKILERNRDDSRVQVPNAEIVRDYDSILNDPSIDLVVVNTPNAFHFPMTKAALLAGKHVIVEKPFTPSVAEGIELIELAQKNKLMLSVYHNRRFASGYCTAKKIIYEKRLGNLKSITINLDRFRQEPGPKKWKEEENPAAGLLYDIGVHLLDESLLLLGVPNFVTADLRVQRALGKVNDYFHIRLDYPEFHVNLNASLLARQPAPAYILHGDEGTYIKHSQDIQEAKLIAGAQPEKLHWADEDEHQWGILHNNDGEHKYPTVAGDYRDFYQNIYAHLCDSERLLVTADAALRTIKMIDIVKASHEQKRTLPVHLL